MAENNEQIDQLLEKLDLLLKRHKAFSEEVNTLRDEIFHLKNSAATLPPEQLSQKRVPESIPGSEPKAARSVSPANIRKPVEAWSDLEKFIGENLINKIGIIITVIGVAIGTKYAIDHHLISPSARIISGYLFGFALLALAFRLKKRYENFSSVLLSGSMAIMYSITFAAYSFYQLIPQALTFILMVVFTVFTVTAAINYNRQVIAHIGLVGAYAVPFLLNDDPGNIAFLLTYTAIINAGILVISVKKYWKPLSYSSFILTWTIYLFWFSSGYRQDEHSGLALLFLTIFFSTFYLMFLAYKLLKEEKFDVFDVILVLANSFIFYGAGYRIVSGETSGWHLPGLFTLGNAIIHSVVSIVIYRKRLADRNLFYLVSGLALVFITIAIPVELDGNWVTFIWAGEAVVLFYTGRIMRVRFYEILSWPMVFLAFISLFHDWVLFVDLPEETGRTVIPFFNIRFLTSLLVTASFGYINYLNHKPGYQIDTGSKETVSFLLSLALVIPLFIMFQIEISTYWENQFHISLAGLEADTREAVSGTLRPEINNYKGIWMINYSLLFFSIFTILNTRKFRSRVWGYITMGLDVFLLFIFLMAGLYILSELREIYLGQETSYPGRGVMNIIVRYISLAFAGILICSVRSYRNQSFMDARSDLNVAFDILLYTSLIWIFSSELFSWMDIFGFSQSYKLALSILWGVYALLLIILGIWKKKKHIRILAIALFSLTLLKLFFYDLTHLNTISRTIVFVTLGSLLLMISFLYNKYRNIIGEKNIE